MVIALEMRKLKLWGIRWQGHNGMDVQAPDPGPTVSKGELDGVP